jgi:hypothetical protein
MEEGKSLDLWWNTGETTKRTPAEALSLRPMLVVEPTTARSAIQLHTFG